VVRAPLGQGAAWTDVVFSQLVTLFTSDMVRGPAFAQAEIESAKVLVYVQRRTLAEELARQLRDRASLADCLLHGILFDHVHADMDDEQRSGALARWREPGAQAVLVATECCAAGLDVPTVRGVFVCGVRNTLINVFQSFGRAGRDGKPALACLLVDERSPPSARMTPAAADTYEEQARLEGQRHLGEYAEGTTCRRQTIHTIMDGSSETLPVPEERQLASSEALRSATCWSVLYLMHRLLCI
jgi:superfamily II DNA helicase RecQ